MLEKYSTIIFDIDGVLLSSVSYYAHLFKKINEELEGEELPYEFFHKHVGTPVEYFLYDKIPDKNHDKIRPMFEQEYAKGIQNIQEVIDGTEELLARLKEENKNIAFVSSKSKQGIEIMIERLNWQKFVDYIVSRDCVNIIKPNPEGTEKVLEYFQEKAENTVFIGDSLHDLGAARATQINFIGVLTGVCSSEDWKKEEVEFVESVKDL